MAAYDSSKRWTAGSVRVARGDVIAAREALVECLYEAQSETFERQKERLGVPSDDASVRQSIVGAVRTAMTRVGGSYDQPTAEHLRAALDVLALKARTWGTPHETIEHHQCEMAKVLDCL